MRTVVTEGRRAAHAGPVAVRAGDPLDHDGRRDEWDGHTWLWVRGPDGREGWMPDALVLAAADGWHATADFDAMELTVAAGEPLTIREATHGWSLCETADGRRGWVPDRHLREGETRMTLHDVACHCGTVRLRVRLSDGLATARRCDCSFCAMRGAVAVSAPADGVEVVAGADALRLYTFGTGVAQHHFCGRCGIYTHHRRRSNPDEYGVNLACIAGHGPFDVAAVPVVDGRSHPADGAGGPAGTVGHLAYTPVDSAR